MFLLVITLCCGSRCRGQGVSTTWFLSGAQAHPHRSKMGRRARLGSASRDDLPRADDRLVFLGSATQILHEGLVGVGALDVTPLIFKADHTLGLASDVRPRMVGMYGRSLSVRSAWHRGAARHSSLNESQRDLRCRGGQVTALPPRLGLAPVGSTSDLGAVVDWLS
ncbi:hypothetical protein GW17_00014693 [Ensete ventricosum]|nr:hypothetical protein GW17_00014693 [Ensete ventricosum]